MLANIESMFYVRKTPWHGLGTRVEFALDSKEALVAAGLDWKVIQKSIMTDDGNLIRKGQTTRLSLKPFLVHT